MEEDIALVENDEPPSPGQGSSNQILDLAAESGGRNPETFIQLNSLLTNYHLSSDPNHPPFITDYSFFESSPETQQFRKEYFPEIPDKEWNDWHWQVRNRIKNLDGLKRIFNLSSEEEQAVSLHQGPLPVAITPYYASRIDRDDVTNALRRTVIKHPDENIISPSEMSDPLGEEHDMAVPGLVHRYPDRVLLLVTGFCSVYCRYCTRSRLVGENISNQKFAMPQLQQALDYIRNHTEIRDVLLSGGDPLTLADERLEWILQQLRSIPHVEFIRIGTKVPVVLPQRVTPKLVGILKNYHPLWMSIHFTHPDELSSETAQACQRLADAGIPLGSQTVLLKGVNDKVEVLKKLYHGLLKNRVRPYYLYQCDPVQGSSHFRTSIARGLQMISGLRGFTSGYAVPHYVVDAPGGGGKIPLLPEYLIGHDARGYHFRNYEGKTYTYPELKDGYPAGEERSC